MCKDDIKVLIKGERVVTLQELFIEEAKARKEMANLSFEEKIQALITLQEIAYSWGGKKDVIIWQRKTKPR
jgi:hypothetical protein